MHVMLDLETLGKKPGCVTLAVGARPFDPLGNGPLSNPYFYHSADIFSQLMAGLDIDPDTLDYWRKQPEQAQREFNRAEPALAIANEFVNWFNRLELPPTIGEIHVWAKSPNFDCEILQRFLETFGQSIPWNFRRVMDVRTVIAVSGIDEKAVPKPVGNIAHHALFDCEWQIAQVQAAYKALGKCIPSYTDTPLPIVTKHSNIDARPISERDIKEPLSSREVMGRPWISPIVDDKV